MYTLWFIHNMTYIIDKISSYVVKFNVEGCLERKVALGFYMARIYRELLFRKSIYTLVLKVDTITELQKIAVDAAFAISFCEGGGLFILLKDLRIVPLKFKVMIVSVISLINLSVNLWDRRYWPKISRWNCRNELIVCVQSIKSSTEFVYVIKAADLVLSLLSGRKPEDLGHSDLVTKR